MRKSLSLSTKLLATGLCFLVMALASIGFMLWGTWKLEGGAAAINEAGRLRMYTARMALALKTGDTERLQELSRRFEEGLDLLRQGTSMRPLFVPWSGETQASFDDVASGWLALRASWLTPASAAAAPVTAQADAFVLRVDAFVAAIETQIARWTATLHVFQIFMMGLAILAAAVFMVMSFVLVFNPVSRMQLALARVRQGELGTRVPVDSDDEFGQLAAGFNLMASALQTSHENLERKVRDKTADIAEHNRRLAALYAVSALGAEATSLEALAQGFVQQIRRVSGSDAAALRWSDEANERYLLLAVDGMPPSLSEREQCLETGACECGQPQQQARLRVIPILPAGGVPLPHCREAGFETVVIIPVQLHQRLLGEVTLLYRAPTQLPADMRELLSTMALHLANAIEGLRASALEREAAVAQERGLIARELHDSIAQSLAFLKIQTQLLRDAIAKDNGAARDRSLDELDVGVRECLADVRELLVHFRTRTQDEDIEDALRATLSKFEHQTGLPTTLTMTGQGLPLAPDVQIQVLHIVQEALSNVRKHAGARHVELRVQRHPHWRFEVIDDGLGFDPQAVPPDSLHVGLGIMRERAQRIGATLTLDSGLGAGTRVTLALPPRALEDLPVTPTTAAA